MTFEISPKINLQMLILRGQSIQNRILSLKDSPKRLESKVKTEIELESRFWGGITDLILDDFGPLARKVTKAYRIA